MNGWYLAPLLALRVRAEESARGELGMALAMAQRADELVLERRLALRAGVAEPGGQVVGIELVVAALFLDRLGRELRDALAGAGEARAAVGTAQQQHAMARRRREGLERERVRWLEARRRAREAAAERELDDGRPSSVTRPARTTPLPPLRMSGPPVSDLSGSARPPERDPVPQPLHELRVIERLANELVRAGLG